MKTLLIFNISMLEDYSNPKEVERKAKRYGVKVFRSTRRDKKYMVYQDYTKHKDKTRRANYLTRSAGIKDSGKYSANQLARHLLW